MSNLSLEYWKISEEVSNPIFATSASACFDIHAWIKAGAKIKCYTPANKEILANANNDDSISIKPGDRMLIPTGLIFKIPEDYSLRIHVRSSVAFKQGLFLANAEGVVDQDYFHETFVMLVNTSTQTVIIKNGDRIAQGELVKTEQYDLLQTFNKPEQITDRVGGIGSTGR
jgi:dUTP pyrophosphatase